MGEVPDGFYELIGQSVNISSASNYSAAQLQRVIEVLRAARSGEPDVDAVASQLEQDAPEVAAVVRRLLVPKDAGQFYALMTLLLTALILLQAQLQSHGTPTPSEIEQVCVHAIEQVVHDPAPTIPQHP